MAKHLIRRTLRGNTLPAVSLIDTYGAEPNDWLRQKYDGTVSYINADSVLVTVWPPHGAEVASTNPLLCAATSQDYNVSALDTATFPFQVKTWGALDATAVQVVSAAGVNSIPAWPTPLTPGAYEWRMQDPVAGWTSWRTFVVRSDAVFDALPTMAGCYAVIAAKAAPRFKPADLSGYAPGGAQRTAYDAMVTRVASITGPPAVPAANSGATQGLGEITFVSDLCHLWWIDGVIARQTELVNRLVGNGTTTGLIQWPWATFTDDLGLRYGAEALALAYDSAKAVLTAPQRTACVAALAAAADRLLTAPGMAHTSFTVSTQGGRWPGQRAHFGGHTDGVFTVAAMVGAALVGDEVGFTGNQNSNIALNVPMLANWLPVVLRVMHPTQADDGSHFEGKGYAGHATDFHPALCAAGNAVGFSYAASARQRMFARTMSRAYPYTLAYHAGPGGHDDSVQWDNRHVAAARRSGEADFALQKTVGAITEAQMAQNKGIDYHWLPSANAALNALAFATHVACRYVTAVHTDPYNQDRISAWFKHQPDGVWNHPGNVVGGWVYSALGQALFLHGTLNDGNAQSRFSKAEDAQAAVSNGTVCFGTALTAAANGMRGSNHGRRTRTRRTQFAAQNGVVKIVQNLDEAADLCASIPATSSATGYLSDLSVKAAAVEQNITITVASVTGSTANACTVTGDVSGSITGTLVNAYVDTSHFYCQIVGNVIVGDTFTFQICKATKARKFQVWLPEGVLLDGAQYEFPSARPVGYRFYTRDVRAPSSASVTAGVLTLAFAGGVGRPNAESVQVEIKGVTGGGANFAAVNGVWAASVSAGGANISVNVSAAAVSDGALTGPVLVNIAPSGPGTLTGDVTVACKSRAAGAQAVAALKPIKAPTGRVLNSPAWFTSDASLSGTIGYAADEQGGLSASDVVYHRWHNRFEYGSLTSLFDWLAAVVPAGVTVAGLGQVISGTTPNRLATLNLTVNGTAYSFVYSEATGLLL